MARNKFENLNLSNAFLFGAALSDRETCRMILEMILGRPVPAVQVHSEHSLFYSSDFRSLRLDVYAADEVQVKYNMEMQNRKRDLAKRSRYHQAEMDATALKPGEDFSDLKPSYVIFICTFDPFGKGLYRYTFEERCLERDFGLGDGTCKIFLSTKGRNPEEVPEQLVNFLRYIENSKDSYVENVNDEQIRALHHKILELKKSREWRERYMTFGELLDDAKQDGMEEGMELGARETQARMLKLVACMKEAGEGDRVFELTESPELLEEMYQKYNL
jgi:predicted transposase/invertase (TIGR01784 family)